MSEKLPNQPSLRDNSNERGGIGNFNKDFFIEGTAKIDLSKLSGIYEHEAGIDNLISDVESTDGHVSFIYQGYDFHGDKMLFSKEGNLSDAWEIEFKRHGGGIDEMTGVGPFKTMKIVLPAVNKIVSMIKEKDSTSPIFFDTDERRLNLYERALAGILKKENRSANNDSKNTKLAG